MNFLNHLIAGLHFPQYFITTTQGGPIKVVLMYLLTEQNYMEEILLVLVQFSPGIIFKTFIEIFHFISTNSLKKLLTLHFWENMFEERLLPFLLLPSLSNFRLFYQMKLAKNFVFTLLCGWRRFYKAFTKPSWNVVECENKNFTLIFNFIWDWNSKA